MLLILPCWRLRLGGDRARGAAMTGRGAAFQVVFMEDLKAKAAGCWDTVSDELVFALKTVCLSLRKCCN